MELPDFDITQQLPQDIMHVLLEGIFPLHLELLLNYIINESSLMSLDQVNSRILEFPYAYFNVKPLPIKNTNFQGSQSGINNNRKEHLITNIFLAFQMWELVNTFPFIIGNEIAQDDNHHRCFMLLSDIASIIFSPVIARDQIPLLKLIIKDYHSISSLPINTQVSLPGTYSKPH